ncbi:MAG: hypothetical protein FJZ00_08875 [Candidatus Sericytochromatia bacterium]|uniref:Uncharacterized protein n=1 Tax=Candidatus Tanganyikabacteria bacterium TaxID=2961651 RepID=A0A938BNJ2_9BACT|nr:hypothetical protein [Candidatus Tanganyikabacteria bacterium]
MTTSKAATDRLNLAAGTLTATPAKTASSTNPADVKVVTDKIKALAGSQNIQFVDDGKTKWSVADAKAIYAVVQKMSPTDRSYLKNATFSREQTLPTENGKPNYGQLKFGAVEKGGPFTVRLGDIASKDGVIADVAAHELGHAMMGGGRWDGSELREFSKLSHWERPDGTLFNGYDSAYTPINVEPGLTPKQASNMVPCHHGDHQTCYAATSPAEDYAESYRAYVQDPNLLMKTAPEKFLYLNANSKAYTPAQVAQFATANGKDLAFEMAELKRSNMRPETSAKIEQANGVAGLGNPGSGAGDLIALVQGKAADPAFAAKLKSNPAEAVGAALWGKLTPAEQAILKNPAYVDRMLEEARANATAARDGISAQDIAVMKEFFRKVALTELDNSTKLSMSNEKILGFASYQFGKTPDKRPEQARFDYFMANLKDPAIWGRLSPDMQKFMSDPETQKGIWNQVNDESAKEAYRRLQGGFSVNLPIFGTQYVGGTPDPKVKAHVARAIDNMGPAELQAWLTLVGSDDPARAKAFGTNLNSIMLNGSLPTKDGPAA